MTDSEKREACRQFYQKWAGKGKEDEDDRSYWLDILQRIMGADDATDRVEFQKKVIVDGHTKRIDAYIHETKIIIEQKSFGIALDRKIHQSGGIDLTPYEQAKRYNDNLPSSEKARWIVISNFSDIWIYDMDTKVPEDNITKVSIKDLQSHYSLLDFLLEKKVKKISKEVELSQEAGTLVGKIYDAFLKQYLHPDDKKTFESLNILCVRLVFCLYAEDAGLFDNKDAFSKYINQYEPKDMRTALVSLFKVLNAPYDVRPDMYLSEELEAFPYCNGGLFDREDIIIPKITQEIKDALADASHFNWREISPTIFGAVFESTLNPETRRSGGMHYTSIENIHKVIDPLFLDDLKTEFAEILKIGVRKQRERKLKEFQVKLASLSFLDPACGSGNFLTETYLSLRRIENDILRELLNGQMLLDNVDELSIKVSIGQFYGVEINDFAADVAKTALWIAESQMMKETESIVLMHLDFLPLKTNANIVIGNALRVDWETVVPKSKLNYIMGNPPFVGSSIKSTAEQQKADKEIVFGSANSVGKLDYVACWYKKAFDYITGTGIEVAFVSTNSITQGEQVRPLWEPLLSCGLHINFAYRTFQWDSEAHIKAHVHCVIICVSRKARKEKFIVIDGSRKAAEHINGYLVDAPDFYIESRGLAPKGMPKLTQGNKPWDDGGLIVSPGERDELIKKYPHLKDYIKLFLGSREFINKIDRYCLWFDGAPPNAYKNIPELKERFEKVASIRRASPTVAVQKQALTPMIFSQIRQPESDYILIPETSSSARYYIPMGFVSKDVIVSNSAMTAADATLYMFGVLESNVHMAWVKTLCGRMKSDYRYSPALYNNFPWPTPTAAQRAKIEQTAQGILDARALFPDSSLATMYDNPMPPELLEAHRKNNIAVMAAYGLSVKDTSEADCVAFLMKKYQGNEGNCEKR